MFAQSVLVYIVREQNTEHSGDIPGYHISDKGFSASEFVAEGSDVLLSEDSE